MAFFTFEVEQAGEMLPVEVEAVWDSGDSDVGCWPGWELVGWKPLYASKKSLQLTKVEREILERQCLEALEGEPHDGQMSGISHSLGWLGSR